MSTIDTIVENFTETKRDSKATLREIVEIRQQINDLMIANGEKPRMTLEQYVQRNIINGDFHADHECLITNQRSLAQYKENTGVK